jgi:hypothetical protein
MVKYSRKALASAGKDSKCPNQINGKRRLVLSKLTTCTRTCEEVVWDRRHESFLEGRKLKAPLCVRLRPLIGCL